MPPEQTDFLILGAGPSGLAFAHALIEGGVAPPRIRVLEKEEEPGGLCRSVGVDGAPLDIGGGHFLDTRRPDVMRFLFRFLPEAEWKAFDRVARIRIHGQETDHPLESNLWQLPLERRIDYLESIARAGAPTGRPVPERFEDWVRWKFGDRIAEDYMLPYNRKLWASDLDHMGVGWLHKLPDVSFRDTLRSCLESRSHAHLPAHARFLYPRAHGYGEVWRRMGQALGDRLVTGCPVTQIDPETRTVNGRWTGRTIVNTIPWTRWRHCCPLPPAVDAAIATLRHVPIDVDYVPQDAGSDAHWIYEPDPSVAHHRMLLRGNFIPGARGYWTEARTSRSPATAEWRHRNEYAYPVQTTSLEASRHVIAAWASAHGILPLGRWGRWEHINSDVAVEQAFAAAIDAIRPPAGL
jgi:protoporphyrinogen oxidase